MASAKGQSNRRRRAIRQGEKAGVLCMAASISTLFRLGASGNQASISGALGPRGASAVTARVERLNHRPHHDVRLLGRGADVAEVSVDGEKGKPMDHTPPAQHLRVRDDLLRDDSVLT